MANRYWVPAAGVATGTWDASTTTNWSATSGGAGGASAPTLSDDVFFDANSDTGAGFTVTMGTGCVCQSIDTSGLDQVMTQAGNAAWSIYGGLIYSATNHNRTYTGNPTFRATTTGWNITTNGVILTNNNTAFNGVGGEWTLGSALTSGGTTVLQNGTLDVSASNYSIVTSNWQKTGGTFVERAGTITLTNASGQFVGGSDTYYDVSYTNTALNAPIITGDNSFNSLNLPLRAAAGQGTLSLGGNQTITTLNAQSGETNPTRRLAIFSNTIGTQRTLTVGTVNADCIDFRDILAAGAGSWNGASKYWGDCKGNSGLTFPTPKNAYRIGTGNWNDTQWAATSGGTPSDVDFPLAQDTCIFDANTTTGVHTLTPANCNIGTTDFSALTSPITLSFAASVNFYGDLVLDSQITAFAGISDSLFCGRTVQNITCAGLSLPNGLDIDAPNTEFKLLDTLTQTRNTGVQLNQGTLNLNSNTLNCNGFNSTNTNTRVIAGGTNGRIVNSASGATAWNMATPTNYSYTGTFTIDMTSASAKTFVGGGGSYPTLNQGGAGILTISGNNSFADATNTVQPTTIRTTAGSTQAFADFHVNGTAGNLVTLDSTGGSYTFTKTGGGTVNVEYVSISNSTATPSDTWYAQLSTDNGNNTGWNIIPGYFPILANFNNTLDSAILIANSSVEITSNLSSQLDQLQFSSQADAAIIAALSKALDDIGLSSSSNILIKSDFSSSLEDAIFNSDLLIQIKPTFNQTLENIQLEAFGYIPISSLTNKTLSNLIIANIAQIEITANLNATLETLIVKARVYQELTKRTSFGQLEKRVLSGQLTKREY
jgi:hypothetical protein